MSSQQSQETPPNKTPEKHAEKHAENSTSSTSCTHVTEGGGPCSVCEPRKSWVADGRMPKEWKHVPWDSLEMKKHHVDGAVARTPTEEELDKELDERPDPSIEEALKKSVRLGESEKSTEIEQWPRVKVSSQRPMSDEDVPPPAVPFFGTSSVSEEEPRSAGGSTRAIRRRLPRSRRKRRSRSITTSRKQIQQVVIPAKARKRSRSVDIALSIQVRVGSRTKSYRIREVKSEK